MCYQLHFSKLCLSCKYHYFRILALTILLVDFNSYLMWLLTIALRQWKATDQRYSAAQFGVFPLLIFLCRCCTILGGDVKAGKLETVGTGDILCVLDRLSHFLTFASCENTFQALKYYTSEGMVTFVCSFQKKIALCLQPVNRMTFLSCQFVFKKYT